VVHVGTSCRAWVRGVEATILVKIGRFLSTFRNIVATERYGLASTSPRQMSIASWALIGVDHIFYSSKRSVSSICQRYQVVWSLTMLLWMLPCLSNLQEELLYFQLAAVSSNLAYSPSFKFVGE
jgi:hypothetical protein